MKKTNFDRMCDEMHEFDKLQDEHYNYEPYRRKWEELKIKYGY